MSVINRSRLHRSQLQGLDLLGKQSVRNAIPVAEAAVHAAAPGEDGAVGGDSEAVFGSRRNGDDALPCQGFDLLGLWMALTVAVAQLAEVATAAAPDETNALRDWDYYVGYDDKASRSPPCAFGQRSALCTYPLISTPGVAHGGATSRTDR